MTRIIWTAAAIVWLCAIASAAFAAEATLHIGARLVVAESPDELAEQLAEIEPEAGEDQEQVVIEETEEGTVVNYE